jgi:Zn2+/Cd2+-exporting ATPase
MTKTASLTANARFKIAGMDCAACVSKIEKAVGRINGVSDVKVGLTSETLTATLSREGGREQILEAVNGLGYKIKSFDKAEDVNKHHDPDGHDHDAEKHHDGDGHDHGDDHSDHGKPIEGAWWLSERGKIVLATAALIGLGYLLKFYNGGVGETATFLIACIVGTYGVAKHAFAAMRVGSFFNIEALMTIAVLGAIAIGEYEEAAIVVCLFALGELLEGIAAGRARSGIKALAQIAPKTAMLETPTGLVETPIANIALKSVVVARPGDRIPADGTILSGVSSVDESAITGESVPRSKDEGDTVLAGSINIESVLRIRVDKPTTDTVIARVVKLVEEASDAKAPSQRFIDQFAKWYMPAICLVALLVVLVPPLLWGQDWNTWIYRGLTLLLIGCPCALVISTPASIASGLAAGARRGLLVKGGGVLEAIGKVKHIAFDKTGTLTEGNPKVTDVVPLGDLKTEDLLRISAAAESGSSHPLALAIVNEAKSRNIAFSPVESKAIPGKGLSATVEGKPVTIGAAGRLGVTDTTALEKATALEAEGKSVSIVLIRNKPAGLIAMRDEPREDAIRGVAAVKALGLNPIMLTGDNRANAEAVGKVLGMEVRAELLPEDKLAVIKQRALHGGIAKVGDGINDAPALAAATVGIAMGSGTDVALEAADAAVMNNRVSDVAALVRLSRNTRAVILQNVTIAMGLKAVFLVTTVFGLTGLWIAILADTGATVLVTANALRLLKTKID